MPAFFAKRNTTMPQSISDDRSEVSSNGSTLKMEVVDPARNKAKRSRTCTIMVAFLLVLLAGVAVAAGVCYLNHMSIMTAVTQWADGNRTASEDVSTTAQVGGLGKRQHYSYGQYPTVNVTAVSTSTVESLVTVTSPVTVTEAASGTSQTIAPTVVGFNTTATETVTNGNTETVTLTPSGSSPSAQSTWTSLNNVTVTNTVLTNETVTATLSATSSLVPSTETTIVSVTGTSTVTAFSNNTVTRTIVPSTVSVPVTVTVSTATVVPIPASVKSTGTVDGVTGNPASWTSSVSGWNSSLSSFVGGPTGGSGTVTVTTTTTIDLNCTTNSLGSTISSNGAATASIPHTGSPTSTGASQLSTRFITTSINYNSTTCTSLIATATEPSSSNTDALRSTVVETFTPSTVATVVVTFTNTPSETGIFGAEGTTVVTTQTVAGTITVTNSQVSTVTQILSLTHSVASTEICVQTAVSTVTATVVETVTQLVTLTGLTSVTLGASAFSVQDESSIMETGLISLASISGTPTPPVSEIPLVSITPNTTVILFGQKNGPSASSTCSKTILTLTTNIMPTSSNADTTPMPVSTTSNLMPHSATDLSTSASMSIPVSDISSSSLNGNTTATDVMSIVGTGVPVTTVYSTMTLPHTNATSSPIVPVQSAGEKKPTPKFWGGNGNSNMCAVMLVATVSLLLI